jgi:hypothetical protein
MIGKTLAMVTLLAIGVTFAYAETSTVEVPFDSHGQSCWYDEMSVEYHCTWQGVVEKFTIEDLKEFKHMLSEETYDREIQRLNEQALAEIAIEKAKLTPNEEIIQEIERKLNKGIATASDSVLMNLLKDLDTCSQGMDDRTAPIQTAREFEISGFEHLTTNNVKADGLLGKISMAIQECEAQKVVYALSVGYANMPTGDDDRQFSLQDKYTPDIQAVNYDSLIATSNAVNSTLICDSNQHSKQYKKQFGCLMLYDGLDAESIKLQNEKRFGTDGLIHYESQVLTDYMNFLNEYGGREATVEDKKVQEAIAEPIARKAIEDNHFYKNHTED